jgi:hypothetical protein
MGDGDPPRHPGQLTVPKVHQAVCDEAYPSIGHRLRQNRFKHGISKVLKQRQWSDTAVGHMLGEITGRGTRTIGHHIVELPIRPSN